MDPRKRKAEAEDVCSTPAVGGDQSLLTTPQATANANKENKKQKAAEPKKERSNTAVYITSLPADVTKEELRRSFSRFGVIAESPDTNEPRIKLYQDEDGKFKGDALVGA